MRALLIARGRHQPMSSATSRTVLVLVGLQGFLSVVYAAAAAEAVLPDVANRGVLGRSVIVAMGLAWPCLVL